MTSNASPQKPMPSRAYLAVIRSIDAFTTWTGYLFILLIVPLVFANVVEVFARYVLRTRRRQCMRKDFTGDHAHDDD